MSTAHAHVPTRPGTARPSRMTWADFGITAAGAVVLYAVGIALYRLIPDDGSAIRGLARSAVSGPAPLGGTVLAVSSVATLLSALVSARAHGLEFAAPVAFIVGVSAALLVRRTGSVWPDAVVRAVNDASSSVIGLRSASS